MKDFFHLRTIEEQGLKIPEEISEYEDILYKERPKGPEIKERVSQFSPFDALSGFDERICEISDFSDRMLEILGDEREKYYE